MVGYYRMQKGSEEIIEDVGIFLTGLGTLILAIVEVLKLTKPRKKKKKRK